MALHWFNTALFLVLALPWLTRWLRFREAALRTLKHPVQANFYPTFSIALLVLAAQWRAFTPYAGVALVLWWLGVVLTFVFSFAALFFMFRGEQVAIEHVTPAQFIPAVGLVIHAAGRCAPVASHDGRDARTGADRECRRPRCRQHDVRRPARHHVVPQISAQAGAGHPDAHGVDTSGANRCHSGET